jgi:hypothetical protein
MRNDCALAASASAAATAAAAAAAAGVEGGASGSSRDLWIKCLLRRAEAYVAMPKLDKALLVSQKLDLAYCLMMMLLKVARNAMQRQF